MRLPQPQLDAIGFLFDNPADQIHAMGKQCPFEEAEEIKRLFDLGLPPVTSPEALSVMLGYSPGFVWSLLNRTHRYYRHFLIPKGSGQRHIAAPRVALKAIQKWLSVHFQRTWQPSDNVFGFVPGRSHIDAASRHLSASWVYSVDIENFFPSVSIDRVQIALSGLGYRTEKSIATLSSVCCLRGHLVQGAPTSPLLSNMVLHDIDQKLASIAEGHNVVFTRYADDIVFSGRGEVPNDVLVAIKATIVGDGWVLADRKEELSSLPKRLKVHGLLVHGEKLRLTKGYRNRIRAYRHLSGRGKIAEDDQAKIAGHINYAVQVEKTG
jgi:RNA-directed DNA polymerase